MRDSQNQTNLKVFINCYVKQFILKLFCEYNSNGYDHVGKMNSLKVDIISFNMQYYKYYYHQYHTKIINYDYIFAHNI